MKSKKLALAFLALWSAGSAWEAYSTEPISAKTHEFKNANGRVQQVWRKCDAYHRIGGDCFFDFSVTSTDGHTFWVRYKDSMPNFDAVRGAVKINSAVSLQFTGCRAGYCTPLAISTPEAGELVTTEQSVNGRTAHKQRWTVIAAGFGVATLVMFMFAGRRPERSGERTA